MRRCSCSTSVGDSSRTAAVASRGWTKVAVSPEPIKPLSRSSPTVSVTSVADRPVKSQSRPTVA